MEHQGALFEPGTGNSNGVSNGTEVYECWRGMYRSPDVIGQHLQTAFLSTNNDQLLRAFPFLEGQTFPTAAIEIRYMLLL